MERRYFLVLFLLAVGMAEGKKNKGKQKECYTVFTGAAGEMTNTDLAVNASCKAVHIKIEAGEPFVFTCSEFSFTNGNDSFCMIVSSKGKKGKKDRKEQKEKKGTDRGRDERSIGDGMNEETALGALANGQPSEPLSQGYFLNRRKRQEMDSDEDGSRSDEEDDDDSDEDRWSFRGSKSRLWNTRGRFRGGKRGKGGKGANKHKGKGEAFCGDEMPTNVAISKDKAGIMLVQKRQRGGRGSRGSRGKRGDAKPVLENVAFRCSWSAQ
ncbi:uncharacterized protein LOC122245418 [Penaeus japonicus]|uniref:uncharacterized protein LOC122245418 n=1 Tax=Penaeus japonicus TaxID=27405 RepID=UPI001C70E885|nr:uncharacterized protein LOC122245418 [Penaeus japonicus]